jgi:hypothetical protein
MQPIKAGGCGMMRQIASPGRGIAAMTQQHMLYLAPHALWSLAMDEVIE